MTPMKIELRQARSSDFSVLRRLMQLYLYDFAAIDDWSISDDGLYGNAATIEGFWTDPRMTSYLVRADGVLAGFALSRDGAYFAGDGTRDISEFFILRRLRRRGRLRGRRRGWQAVAGRRVGRRLARGAPQRFVQLGRGLAHLVGDLGRVDRGADHARRDQEQQLGLLDQSLGEPEQVTDQRDVLEERDPAVGGRQLVLDEPTQHERLTAQQHDRGLRLALDERGRVRRRHRRSDRVHFLLHVERDRALLADARRHREDHTRVAILDGLVEPGGRRRSRRGRGGGGDLSGGLAGDDGDRRRHVDDRLLVLRGHDVRVRVDVDLVVARQRIEHRDEMVRREREGRESLAEGSQKRRRAPDAGRERHRAAVG